MAYPTVDAPYGYKPVNLIGGQVFAGSTRMYPIQYAYGTSLFYGDPVTLSAGYVNISSLPVNTTNTIVGVFLGCSYTNPTTKQKLFSQYWPASTATGDAVAYIADDPDIIIRTSVATAANAVTIGSLPSLLVGQNVVGNSGATIVGAVTNGNSKNGVVTATANTANAGFRVIGLVPDSQINTSCTYVSGGAAAATSVTVSGLTVGQVIPSGTDIFNVDASGFLQYVGACTSGSTTVSSATSQSFTTTAITTQVAGTVALVQSPEVLVKINFNVHRYNIV
jgi:hypothetical protein